MAVLEAKTQNIKDGKYVGQLLAQLGAMRDKYEEEDEAEVPESASRKRKRVRFFLIY